MISKKSVLWAVFIMLPLILLIGAFIAYKQYTKPHRLIEEEIAISIEASQLFEEFEANEAEANHKYLNKVVAVTGTVVDVSTNQEDALIILLETQSPMFGVSCTLEQKSDIIKEGSRITVKGICTGYLSDVVINRARVVNVR